MIMKLLKISPIFFLLFCQIFQIQSQENDEDDQLILDYQDPKIFTLAGIRVEGNQEISKNIVIAFTGLKTGEELKVPGEKLTKAINNLWEQRLFSDIKLKIDEIRGEKIYLLLEVKTRPRLSKFKIKNVSKKDADKIRQKISLVRGDIVTNQLINNVRSKIKKYYADQGYLKTKVKITRKPDTVFSRNSTILHIDIDEKKKVKIRDIVFTGNEKIKVRKLRRVMKNTNKLSIWNILKSSKFNREDYEADRKKLIDFYNSRGFRDARIASDSVYYVDDFRVNIQINLDRGEKYYFRNITWTGNTKYSTKTLNNILAVKKGEVYNTQLLQRKLFFNPNGLDVSSLYMDNGYLFFNVRPVETKVVDDSIDIEIRIFEGPQATVDEVTISGNTKTSDHVILRELRTRPGDKFNRSALIRSQRALSQLGYFDPKGIEVIPKPDPETGTVDIEYKVVEKPSDQFQLQGGYGQGYLVGTLALAFNNFAMDKVFEAGAWDPIPSGHGQKFRISAQSTGRRFSSYNLSFTEPWFGGKKPNSFTISTYHSLQSNGAKKEDPKRRDLKITGITIGLGQRLNFPDDYFTLNHSLSLERFNVNNYGTIFAFSNGVSNNISLEHTLSRNSIDHPIYPQTGSKFSLSVKYTPPYSSFSGKNYLNASEQEKFKWVEYHKWQFNGEWFFNLVDKLVLATHTSMGFLGHYNKDIGPAPFERYFVGGDGISGYYQLDGRELIKLRGYPNNSLSPDHGSILFNRHYFELRYPISLNPQATVYVLGFGEAGNAWNDSKNFNPFDTYRSAGAGVRVYLPMFGLLGFDWGYGFDDIPGIKRSKTGEFHLVIGQQF